MSRALHRLKFWSYIISLNAERTTARQFSHDVPVWLFALSSAVHADAIRHWLRRLCDELLEEEAYQLRKKEKLFPKKIDNFWKQRS